MLTELSKHIEHASLAELPALIGELERARAQAWARLYQPVPAQVPAQTLAEPLAGSSSSEASQRPMVNIGEAAKRLGMSKNWLYRNARTLPFAHQLSNRWRFNMRGLEKYLRDRQGCQG